jgi:hypothetical protein
MRVISTYRKVGAFLYCVISRAAVENSLTEKWSKKLCNSKPYKRLISVLVDIFYLPNSGYFDKTGVFQQPQAISLIEGV